VPEGGLENACQPLLLVTRLDAWPATELSRKNPLTAASEKAGAQTGARDERRTWPEADRVDHPVTRSTPATGLSPSSLPPATGSSDHVPTRRSSSPFQAS
jgi:endonuclease/exonuclease/phosphatase family metal-dependent hydrolase